MSMRSGTLELPGIATASVTRRARRALGALVATDANPAQTVTRLVLGGVMLPHGMQKTVGLFGGYGFEGTMGFLTSGMGLPWLVAVLVIVIETLGAIALLAGAASRVAAAGVAAVMAGAVATSHLTHGFFMNWSGTQGGEGFEFHLLAIGMALAIVVRGGGAVSVDGLLQRRLVRQS